MTRRMLDIGAPGGRYVAAWNTKADDNIPPANRLAYRDEFVRCL